MSDQYPPPGSYPPPGGGGNPTSGGGGYPTSGGGGYPTSGGGGYPPASGGYPPPGGGYPPPGGDQPPPFGPPAGAPFGAPPPPPPKKSSAGKIILIILLVIVLLTALCCGGIFFFAKDTWNDFMDEVQSSSTNAKVGDCLTGDAIEGDQTRDVNVKIVKCDDATAMYKVIGIKESVPKAEALKDEPTVCDDFINQGANRVLWQGTNDASGQALCLGDAK